MPEDAEVRLGADEPDGERGRLEVLAHRGRLVVLEEGEQAEVGALVDAAEYGVWVARAAIQGHRVVERVGDRPEKISLLPWLKFLFTTKEDITPTVAGQRGPATVWGDIFLVHDPTPELAAPTTQGPESEATC